MPRGGSVRLNDGLGRDGASGLCGANIGFGTAYEPWSCRAKGWC